MPDYERHGLTARGSIVTPLQVFVKYLRSDVNRILPREKLEAFLTVGLDLEKRLRAAQPKVSGTFAAGWKMDAISADGVTIVNDVKYAAILEGGVLPGNKPWPNPTKRVVNFEGRHWSSKAPGGNIEKMLKAPYVFADRAAHMLANRMVNAFFQPGKIDETMYPKQGGRLYSFPKK